MDKAIDKKMRTILGSRKMAKKLKDKNKKFSKNFLSPKVQGTLGAKNPAGIFQHLKLLRSLSKDKIKIALSLCVIIALAAVIVNIDRVLPQTGSIAEKTAEGGGEKRNKADLADYGKCFNKSPDTLVFVHSNYCPHCRDMMPVVEELEREGYKFYWAESSDAEASSVISSCFSSLISGYVPQFICPATGEEKTGQMSKADLKRFADACVQG